MARKVLITLMFLFFLAISPVAASSGQNISAANNSYAATFLNNLVSSLTTSIAGAYDENGDLLQPGAITFFAQGIDTMASVRPASGIDFARYLSDRLQFPGTPKAAYAQSAPGGIGYSSLTPLLPLWLLMRDIAYWFFSIAFVVAGLMIMFRFKIDPKTAASIQSALPKIIFALIIVTFSYAIAGFLIDIMYVLIALILNLISTVHGGYAGFTEKVANHSIFSFWLSEAGATSSAAAQAVGEITYQFLRKPLSDAGGQLTGLITGSIAGLIIMIAVLWVLFKTWLMLLNCYANIMLNIIFAPVILMLDAIPGQNQFEGWLRNMLAYLLSFPAVIVLMYVGLVLSVGSMQINEAGFVPPLIGGNSQSAIQALVGLAILLTTPKTVEALQQILKTPENKFGSAWSEALGWSWNQVSGKAGGAVGFAAKPVAREGLEKAKTWGTGTFVERVADAGIAAGQKSKWWTS